MESLVVIPARYDAVRFPGKSLVDIRGKSLIQRVFEQASRSKASEVIVATDDRRIFDAVEAFGGNAIMTSSKHTNGTQRCAEVLERMEDSEAFDVVINVQGDEPFIRPEQIDALIDLFEEEEVEIATYVKKITDLKAVNDPNTVKAVLTIFDEGSADALYFSRAPIPFVRDEKQLTETDYYKHIGIYAFQPEVLHAVVNLDESNLEKAEKLEQLRWIENHFVVTALETDHESIGIDSEADLDDVDTFLKKHPEFLD